MLTQNVTPGHSAVDCLDGGLYEVRIINAVGLILVYLLLLCAWRNSDLFIIVDGMMQKMAQHGIMRFSACDWLPECDLGANSIC